MLKLTLKIMKMRDEVSNAPVSSPLMVPMYDGNRFIKLMCCTPP